MSDYDEQIEQLNDAESIPQLTMETGPSHFYLKI